MRRRSLQSALVVLSLGLAGCSVQVRTGSYSENRKVAERATAAFHDQLSEERFTDLYAATDDRFRATGTREELVAHMKATRDQFGAFMECNIRAVSCFPDQVRVVAHTKYAEGSATEIFTWGVRDGTAKLAVFQISPGLAEIPEGVSNECR